MIDEKKLIEKIWNIFSETYNNAFKFDEDESKLVERVMIDVQHAIEEQPKICVWIPMEEKLPPDGQKVLLSCNYMMFDYVTVGTIENGNRGKSYIADEDTFMRSAILAWQPLPNTYCK